MKNIAPLTKRAVEAAKNKDWNLAIEINEAILQEDSHNIGALNRLALARMQLGHVRVAKRYLTKVLELDKHNKIASKNLSRVEKRDKNPKISFNQKNSYIEEPGKAQIISLMRLADKKTLDQVSVGQSSFLEPKKNYISIYLIEEDNGKQTQYLGALPKEISLRLMKLIKTGNKYSCTVHSINADEEKCKVLIKESRVSEANQGITSFPISKQIQSEIIADFSEEYLATGEEKSEANTYGKDEEIIADEIDEEEDDDNEEFD